MGHSTWSTSVTVARTDAELLALLREYLAAFGVEARRPLPAECHDLELHDVEAISTHALTLARCDLFLEADAPSRELLRQMSLTFAAAQARLRAIRSLLPPTV